MLPINNLLSKSRVFQHLLLEELADYGWIVSLDLFVVENMKFAVTTNNLHYFSPFQQAHLQYFVNPVKPISSRLGI